MSTPPSPSRPKARSFSRALWLAGLVATLGACSSPPTRYYTLREHPVGVVVGGGTGVAAVAAPARFGVYVADVTVPASVDRQPLVVADSGNIVTVQEFDQWAAPLDAQVTRVVVADLRQLLGTPSVASDLDLVGDPRALRVRLVIERFEGKAGAGGNVAVRARWSIGRPARDKDRDRDRDADKDRPPFVDSVTVERPVAGARIDDVVNAWNDALWEVSQDLARDLVAASRS